MPDKIELRAFPSSTTEALTMLYLQNQNLKNMTPEELAKIYKEISERIWKELNDR